MSEFRQIAHSGGQVQFCVRTDEQGVRGYTIGYQSSRPVPSAIFGVWALPQGIAAAFLRLGGIGVPWNAPPSADCLPVLICSDSEGLFGRECYACKGYWRSNFSILCPYCAARGEVHEFLTAAQQDYVYKYCKLLTDALASEGDGDYVIDLDAVADAVDASCEKPPFYYTEESQQKKFGCNSCGALQDVIGRFCYCSTCGTRNDLEEFRTTTLKTIREAIQASEDHGRRIVEIAGAFDTYIAQYVREIIKRVPMRSRRKNRLERMRFHNLPLVTDELKTACDVDVTLGFVPEDVSFATTMFYRRHVYEHNGGVVDQKYLTDSEDTAVRLNQHLREDRQTAHRLAGLVDRMIENMHVGFHDIFVPEKEPIEIHTKARTRFGRSS